MTLTTALQPLTLQEQMLLLILNDENGGLEGLHTGYSLNAAALAELALRERITLNGDTVLLRDPAPTGNVALDLALEHLVKCRRPQSLTWWVECAYPDILAAREVVVEQLVERGIVLRREEPLLWGANLNVYPTVDHQPERELRDLIGMSLLSEEAPARIAVLVALLEGSQGLSLALNRMERILWKQTVQSIVESNPIGKAIGKALTRVIQRDFTTMPAFALVSA